MGKITKGSHQKLNVTEQARKRIMVGLGWDPAEKPSFTDKIKKMAGIKHLHHDLDLFCYYYDDARQYIDLVSAEPGKTVNADSTIYHSGDNEEGYGEGDDEEISVELRDLDKNIVHLIFKTEVRTGHSFDEISAPAMRIADGYTDHNFLEADLKSIEGDNASAYVFIHIYRNGDNWKIHYIDEFFDASTVSNWPEELKRFLKVE